MSDKQKQVITVSEAEERTSRAVDELEKVINRIDGTPGKRSEKRRAKLASLFMSLLADEYQIMIPAQEEKCINTM